MRHVKLGLRWVIALPAGLIAAILVMFPVHWGIMLVYGFSSLNQESVVTTIGADGEIVGCGLLGLTCVVPAESLERIAQAFVTPFVTLTVVASIAPKYKFYAVAVLFTLYLLFFGAAMGMAALTGGGQFVESVGFTGYSGWGWLEFVAVLAFGVSGAAIAVYSKFVEWQGIRQVT